MDPCTRCGDLGVSCFVPIHDGIDVESCVRCRVRDLECNRTSADGSRQETGDMLIPDFDPQMDIVDAITYFDSLERINEMLNRYRKAAVEEMMHRIAEQEGDGYNPRTQE